ncbi:hypothetical protein EDB86DRAFT_2828962 [Lactarius hatsudake]|nr:hypothetical protein EDB86DRAFT_2828962 [Lactarius hatsudake]
MQEGRCAQSSPLRAGCATPALPVYAPRPGGGAHARGAHGTRGGATRARAAHPSACAQGVRAKRGATRVGELRANGRKGEGVMSGAKRSPHEAARERRAPPHQ